MIQIATLQFLNELALNNNKPWFDVNRPAYEAARKDVIAFANKVIASISTFDASIAMANIDPKSTISRINRDVRFSNDKSPYKTNFFILVSAGGKKGNKAAYYLEIRPDGCFLGGGAYMPMPEDLLLFRQEIDYNFKEWKAIVDAESFRKIFARGIEAPEKLSRPPKGFEPSSEAIEYLKMKGFYCWKKITDAQITSEAGFAGIEEALCTTEPLVRFLNRAVQ